jgi:hypothetical protein
MGNWCDCSSAAATKSPIPSKDSASVVRFNHIVPARVLSSMHKDVREAGEVKSVEGEFLLRVDGGATVNNLCFHICSLAPLLHTFFFYFTFGSSLALACFRCSLTKYQPDFSRCT